MIADAVNDHGANAVRQVGETILDREDDAVVQRIALGRAVEPDAGRRALLLDPKQVGLTRGGDGRRRFPWATCFQSRIVMFYNDIGSSQAVLF